MSATTKTEPQGRQSGIQVIARAAAILRELGDHPDGRSLAELGRALELPRSTIQRIIGALETEGFVEMVSHHGGYRLGPELGRLLYHTRIDAITVVRPLLEKLCHDVNETVAFCGIENNQVLVIDRIVAERALRVVPAMGVMHVPFHSTSVGKVLLATMSDEKISDLLAETLPTKDRTKQRKAALMKEIHQIRRTGIAEDYEEYAEELAAFAVALDTYLGPFAVAILAPASRARARRQEYEEPLRVFKARVEEKIGR
ncbi:helix-turn-helix domain-containing protein [Marinobacter bryozoorum]|uniref:IclR family transcriptional regulator n=1 Tax=Marinobacter bryozoorum TaxID=256324 RepID=UPI002005E6B9|nr:IclR family transcriptional regulator C-terminal domain-containing protein [Marinobacter bryozoorum]MCK7543486.1 helix-turn-helix domain-containing protein [Marinobacter bryozoorum]